MVRAEGVGFMILVIPGIGSRVMVVMVSPAGGVRILLRSFVSMEKGVQLGVDRSKLPKQQICAEKNSQ